MHLRCLHHCKAAHVYCSAASIAVVPRALTRKVSNRHRRAKRYLSGRLAIASTSYDILFQNEAPYLLVKSPGDKPLIQMTTVVKFADDHDEKTVAGATALILDRTGLVADGPVGILGLGAGTVAHLIHHFWPDREMVGWELDADLLPIVRVHMGLQQLEDSGILTCHAGDALADSATVEGGFAGLVVDLFGEGRVISELQQVDVWQSLKQRLRPGGRIIANISDELPVAKAMLEVFGEVHFHPPLSKTTRNCIALTGPAVNDATWSSLPGELSHCTSGWLPLDQMDPKGWES